MSAENYQPVRQENLPPVPQARHSQEVVGSQVVDPLSQEIDQLELMLSAPSATDPQVAPETTGRHRAPETEAQTAGVIATARRVGPRHKTEVELAYEAEQAAKPTSHASNEVAAPSNYEGRHSDPAETNDRFLVRSFTRLANFAAKRAENWGSRRTTREFAGAQVERGRNAARRVGNAVTSSAKGAGEYMANNLRTGIEADKRNIEQTKNLAITGGRAARAHKDVLVAAAKSRMGKIGEGIRSGAEKAGRAAKLGANVLKFAGFAVVGTGVIAVEGAKEGVKYGAQKTAEGAKYSGRKVAAGANVVGREVKRTAQDVRENAADIHTGVIEHQAQRAKAKHERKSEKAKARRAAAEARN